MFKMTCPPCGQEISAASEDELIVAVREHARTDHNQELSPDDVRAAMAPQPTT